MAGLMDDRSWGDRGPGASWMGALLGGNQRAWRQSTPGRSAGKRGWAATAWLVTGTLAVALTSYSLSLQVSNERRETERLQRQNLLLESDLKALEAELRVRMRMPQLQRWNDDVLGLVPISATQYLVDPLQLVRYGKPLPGELADVQLAVRDVLPADPSAAQRRDGPRLVSADPVIAGAVPAPGALVGPAQARVAAASGPVVPVQPASEPDDLLRQVALTLESAPGQTP